MTLAEQMLPAFEQGQGPCFTCGAHAVEFVDEDGQPVRTLAPKPPIGVHCRAYGMTHVYRGGNRA